MFSEASFIALVITIGIFFIISLIIKNKLTEQVSKQKFEYCETMSFTQYSEIMSTLESSQRLINFEMDFCQLLTPALAFVIGYFLEHDILSASWFSATAFIVFSTLYRLSYFVTNYSENNPKLTSVQEIMNDVLYLNKYDYQDIPKEYCSRLSKQMRHKEKCFQTFRLVF